MRPRQAGRPGPRAWRARPVPPVVGIEGQGAVDHLDDAPGQVGRGLVQGLARCRARQRDLVGQRRRWVHLLARQDQEHRSAQAPYVGPAVDPAELSRTGSGATNPGVPNQPGRKGSAQTRRASPKSEQPACPDHVRKTFAGLMSWWTIPRSCAAATASSSASKIVAASSAGRLPPFSSCAAPASRRRAAPWADTASVPGQHLARHVDDTRVIHGARQRRLASRQHHQRRERGLPLPEKLHGGALAALGVGLARPSCRPRRADAEAATARRVAARRAAGRAACPCPWCPPPHVAA